MIEPRVYRAAFVPAVLALVIAMFSLETQPPGATLELPADVLFEGETVAETAERIAREQPDRTPGSPGNAAVGERVAAELEDAGFGVRVDDFDERGHELRNVVGTRVGLDRERIVVLAGRDAASTPDLAGSAADTAALLEVANALEGRAPEKTIVLASVDGSTLGDAGARRLAETLPDVDFVEAALVLSDVGSPGSDGPRAVAWSNDPSRVSIGLSRTAEESLRREFADLPADAGIPTQLAQLALPVGVGAQGVLLDRGIEAIRFSGSGLLPPVDAAEIDPDRVGGLGRAVLQTAFALDVGEGVDHGPPSYVIVSRSVVPGWAVSLLAIALVLPVLVASVDAFARARRRREPVSAWISWVLARIVPFALGLLVALLLVIFGLVPNTAGAAPPPALEPLDGRGAAALGIVAAVVVLALIFLRPLLARLGGAPADPAAPGAGCAVALLVAIAAVAVWAWSPVAAIVLAPAAHVWALAALAEEPGGIRGRTALVCLGLVPPLLVGAIHMVQLSLDPLSATWYLFLLVTGGQVSLLGALLVCVLLGTLVALAEILLARRRHARAALKALPVVRGPGGYAGPGSLGGTESAVKH